MASHVHSQCSRYVVVREHFDFLGQVSDIRDKEGPSLRLKATVVDNRQIIELRLRPVEFLLGVVVMMTKVPRPL